MDAKLIQNINAIPGIHSIAPPPFYIPPSLGSYIEDPDCLLLRKYLVWLPWDEFTKSEEVIAIINARQAELREA